MKSPFRSAYKITQFFANDPLYYGKFGLKGHEGIDLVPSQGSWDVLALADGVIVRDDDIAGDPKADAYGKFVTIWHKSLNKATQYCHLYENIVSEGQEVKLGQKIGLMGQSGNTNGAHLHLNLFETDKNGTRLNITNGYLGGIDPLPFLQESGGEQPVSNTIQDQSDAFIALCTELGVKNPKKDEALEKVRSLKADTEDVSKLRAQFNIDDSFRKQISKLLVNTEGLTWQKVFEEVDKTIKEHDDALAKAGLSLELWNDISKKVEKEFAYPIQIHEIKQALENYKTRACKELKDYKWEILLVQAWTNFWSQPRDQKEGK